MQVFVGVDPSITNTAIIVLDESGNVVNWFNSKNRSNKLAKDVNNYDLLVLEDIANSVVNIININNNSSNTNTNNNNNIIIGYENYSFDSVNKAFRMGEFNGVLKLALAKKYNNNSLILVAPKTVKSFATSNSNASKEAMIKQAIQEWPVYTTLPQPEQTDDLADAYFIAKYTLFKKAPQLAIRTKPVLNLRHRLKISQALV